MPLLPYGPEWRYQRRLANAAMNGDAVKKFYRTQEQHVTAFLADLLREPGQFDNHLRL
jgi:cytochrome P450